MIEGEEGGDEGLGDRFGRGLDGGGEEREEGGKFCGYTREKGENLSGRECCIGRRFVRKVGFWCVARVE